MPTTDTAPARGCTASNDQLLEHLRLTPTSLPVSCQHRNPGTTATVLLAAR